MNPCCQLSRQSTGESDGTTTAKNAGQPAPDGAWLFICPLDHSELRSREALQIMSRGERTDAAAGGD